MNLALLAKSFYLCLIGQLGHLIRDIEAVGLTRGANFERRASKLLLNRALLVHDCLAITLAVLKEAAVAQVTNLKSVLGIKNA